jgi:glutamyl-tRNA synthetase
MSKIRTRFAPSPTGYLHIGGLRTALYGYLYAKKQGGDFILRIEDTDTARYVDGSVQIIYDTMRDSGIMYDEGPDVGGNYGPYVQSERRNIYTEYAKKLVELGGAYYCFCTPERIATLKDDDGNMRYDKHCLKLSKEEIEQRIANGEPYVIRQNVPESGTGSYHDLVYGDISVDYKDIEDGILIKSDGMPTYNFANVIDDHLMGITHVIRGIEYLSSTPKYNLMYDAYGWERPVYIHLPPIMKDAQHKLSKRNGDASYEDFVKKGYVKEAIVNYIALLGWSPKNDNEIFPLSQLAEIFNIAGLNKVSAVFDYAKLRWMNTEYIRKTSLEDFTAMAFKFSQLEGTALEASWSKIAAILHQRMELLSEIPEKIAFLVKLPEFELDLFNNKKSKCDPASALEILKEVVPQFEALVDWTPENIGNVISSYAEKYEVKLGKPMWAVRIAVSGCAVTPGGPSEIMDILGKEESLKRLAQAMERLSAI